MMKMKKVGVVLCVLLMAGAAHAAYSRVDVTGTLSVEAESFSITPSAASQSVAASVDATDLDDLDGLEVTDSASDSATWGVGWTPSGAFTPQTPVYTATFQVSQDLFTENAGDYANADITLTLALTGDETATVSQTINFAVVDGETSGPTMEEVVLTLETPRTAWGTKFGIVTLSVEIDGVAFMAEVIVIPEEPPVNPPSAVPAPGAILLSSLGVGVVGWLRRRRSL